MFLLTPATDVVAKAAQRAAEASELWSADSSVDFKEKNSETPQAASRALEFLLQSLGGLMLLQRLQILASTALNAAEEMALKDKDKDRDGEGHSPSPEATKKSAAPRGGREVVRLAMQVYRQLHPLDRWECAAFVQPLVASFHFHFLREEGGALQRLERPDWPASFLLSRITKVQEFLLQQGDASLGACAARLSEGLVKEDEGRTGVVQERERETLNWLFASPMPPSSAESGEGARAQQLSASSRSLLQKLGREAFAQVPFEEAAAVHAARVFRLMLLWRLPFIVFAEGASTQKEKRTANDCLLSSGASTLFLMHVEELQRLSQQLRPLSARAGAELSRDFDADTLLQNPFQQTSQESAADPAKPQAEAEERREGVSQPWEEDNLDWNSLDALQTETDEETPVARPSPSEDNGGPAAALGGGVFVPSLEMWRSACAGGPLDLTTLLQGAHQQTKTPPLSLKPSGGTLGMLQVLVNLDGLYVQRQVDDLLRTGAATRRCTDTAAAAAAISPDDPWMPFSRCGFVS